MDKRFALALKYYEAGFHNEAWNALREGLAEGLHSSDALGLGAVLRLEARAYDEAIELCDRLIGSQPEHAGAWLWKAQALFRLGRMDAGDKAVATAVELPASHPAGWNNLGNLLDEQGRPDAALAALARAIQQAPEFSLAHNNLGTVLAGQGRFAAACVAHLQALESDPHNLAARSNLGVALLEQGLHAEAMRAFDAVLAVDPSMRDAADNRLYAGIYSEDDPRNTHAAHVAWGKNMPLPPSFRPADFAPMRRLRIGYISPDFRRHSVSFFVEPILEAHDATVVEVFCYADVAQNDVVTERLKAKAGHWRDIHGASDEDVFKLIRGDQIDVLVDLSGHTKGNRLAVFARRAAPVQVTAWGYPATTGLPAMDYRLCDVVSDPATDADALAVETLIRLTPSLHCYAPPDDAPPVAPLPAMAAGHITFGAFNKLAKISTDTVALWASVLNAVPGSRLLLKTKPLTEDVTRERVAGIFAAHGVAAERLDLRGWVPEDRGHLSLYNQVDVALDTMPYNGTTTTCEALWMGVPVLTLFGRSHAGRVGASLLTQVGMADWIAAAPDQFAVRAVALASDFAGLSRLRQSLRARVAASPLCNAAAHARGVENAYRAMWRKVGAASASQ